MNGDGVAAAGKSERRFHKRRRGFSELVLTRSPFCIEQIPRRTQGNGPVFRKSEICLAVLDFSKDERKIRSGRGISIAEKKPKGNHGMKGRRAAVGRTAIGLSVVIIALAVVLGFALLSPQSVTQTATTSPSETQSKGSSTTTGSSTASYAYLSAGGGCVAGGEAAPCWGSPAYVFNCLSAAKTGQGCTQLVIGTTPNWNFTVNVRYPFSNQTNSEPSWANCLWSIQGGTPGQGYGYCSLVNSTSFTVGEPAPPPQ